MITPNGEVLAALQARGEATVEQLSGDLGVPEPRVRAALLRLEGSRVERVGTSSATHVDGSRAGGRLKFVWRVRA